MVRKEYSRVKRTLLKRRTPLKAKKGINPMSVKRREEYGKERGDRELLCQRAGGIFSVGKDSEGNIIHYTCQWGKCEVCGKSPDGLSDYCLFPAEVRSRAQMGKVGLWNSLMACFRPTCHNHDKFKNGLPMSDEEAYDLIRKLNKENLGISLPLEEKE